MPLAVSKASSLSHDPLFTAKQLSVTVKFKQKRLQLNAVNAGTASALQLDAS
jgi:hypothetical protein